MSLASQSNWRLITSHWYPSWAIPTLAACHHGSYASGFASCDSTTLSVTFLASFYTQLTHFPVPQSTPPDVNHIHEDTQTELFVHALASNLPASADRLKAFRDAQQKDSTCSQLITFCKQGWPSKSQITGDLSQYWRVRGELSLHDDLLLRGQRILVLRSLQQKTLNKIHSGDQGI